MEPADFDDTIDMPELPSLVERRAQRTLATGLAGLVRLDLIADSPISLSRRQAVGTETRDDDRPSRP